MPKRIRDAVLAVLALFSGTFAVVVLAIALGGCAGHGATPPAPHAHDCFPALKCAPGPR